MNEVNLGGITLRYTPAPGALDIDGGNRTVEEVTLLDGSSAVQVSEKAGALKFRLNRTDGHVVTASEKAALLALHAGGPFSVYFQAMGEGSAEAFFTRRPKFWPVVVGAETLYEYELEVIG